MTALAVVLVVGLLAVAPVAAVGLDEGDDDGINRTLTGSQSTMESDGGSMDSTKTAPDDSTDSDSSGTTDSGDTNRDTSGDADGSTASGDTTTSGGEDTAAGASAALEEETTRVVRKVTHLGGSLGDVGSSFDTFGDDTEGTVGGTTDAVTGTVGDTTDTLASPEQLLDSGAVRPNGGDDTPRPDTQAGATAGEPATGEYLGTNLPVPGPDGFALGFGAVAVASAAAGFRSGVLSGGLSNVARTLATILNAGLAPVAAQTSAFERLPRIFAPLRYSRYDDSDPLDHEPRARVFEVIEETPGAYLSEVAENAGLPLSTARHHVRVLEREDLISGAKVRGKRRFYPANATGIELVAALNDEATATLLDTVVRLDGASVSDLAAELERDPSTVTHHLKRLEADGIVVRERDGRTVVTRLVPEARRALDPETTVDELVAPSATAGGAD